MYMDELPNGEKIITGKQCATLEMNSAKSNELNLQKYTLLTEAVGIYVILF